MSYWSDWIQPSYPRRVARFVDFDSGSLRDFTIPGGIVDRGDYTIHNIAVEDLPLNTYPAFGVGNVAVAVDDPPNMAEVRLAALSGTPNSGATVSVSGEAGGSTSPNYQVSALGQVANSIKLIGTAGNVYGHLDVLDEAPSGPDVLAVELHPDDYTTPDPYDPFSSTAPGDRGEVLDAWLGVVWNSNAYAADAGDLGSASVRFTTPPRTGIGYLSGATEELHFADPDTVTLDAPGLADTDGNSEWLPVKQEDPQATALEFPSLAARRDLIVEVSDTTDPWHPSSGRIAIAYGANAVEALPAEWEAAMTAGEAFGSIFLHTITQEIVYRPPRYRILYAGDRPVTIPPPRQIYPRTDGLTGGAEQIYPQHKSQQFSNRVVGGYV
jgi:hypothetical protein